MKKKIQKPFSIEAWRNGAKVETRSGRSVRILCTDLKDNYPIVAAIANNDGTECSCIFDADGHFCTGSEDDCDLVIVEEVEEPEQWTKKRDAKGEGWFIGIESAIWKNVSKLNHPCNFNEFATEKQAKSALAMARISQLMAHDERYGGVVTDEEWKCSKIDKFVLYRHEDKITYGLTSHTYRFLAFHTEEQCDLFLAENERLVKDYLMID